MTKIVLDSSVIITGINSTKGASHFVLKLSKEKRVEASISEIVLQEVMRNLKKKFPEKVLIRFLNYLAESNFKKIDFEKESGILKYQDITEAKDVHVIAAAFKSEADYLITLDKKHLLRIKQKLPFKIITPSELLKSVRS